MLKVPPYVLFSHKQGFRGTISWKSTINNKYRISNSASQYPNCVFLCSSLIDRPAVREFYQLLKAEGWIDPWLDDEKLFPGQDWDLEIEKGVEAVDMGFRIVYCEPLH